MRKKEIKELEELEKIQKQKALSEEEKQEIKKMAYNNLMNAISIMLFLIILIIIPLFVKKEITTIICKVSSIIILLLSIFLFEVAYKRDDGMLAISGIEILLLSIIVLFAPYGFVRLQSKFLQLSGAYYAIYYTIKTIIIYVRKRKKYLSEFNDIPEIIKK